MPLPFLASRICLLFLAPPSVKASKFGPSSSQPAVWSSLLCLPPLFFPPSFTFEDPCYIWHTQIIRYNSVFPILRSADQQLNCIFDFNLEMQSSWVKVDPKAHDKCLFKREEGRGWTRGSESDGKDGSDASRGREYQGLLASTRRKGGGMEHTLLQNPQKESSLLTS